MSKGLLWSRIQKPSESKSRGQASTSPKKARLAPFPDEAADLQFQFSLLKIF